MFTAYAKPPLRPVATRTIGRSPTASSEPSVEWLSTTTTATPAVAASGSTQARSVAALW